MSEQSVTASSLLGTVLDGRYELRAFVGRGGMGEVYEAVDRQLGRTVAIKVLRPELAADHGFTVRFRREARTSAKLSHPGIVAVHDIGEDGGRVFIVMEFVSGRDLGRVIHDDAPVDPARAARIGAEAAEALAHAHVRGVVHRDVAPGNVMIAADGRVRILDFGIARASRGSSARSGSDAQGTVPYVSPERLRGEAADQRVDVYALGAVLYELLTGRAPRRDEGPITPPRSVRPNVPETLDRIVMRCLAFDPAARYLRTADLARELRVLSGGDDSREEGGVAGGTAAEPHPSSRRTAVLLPPAATRPLPVATASTTAPLPVPGAPTVRPSLPATRRPHRGLRLGVVAAMAATILAAAWIAVPAIASLTGSVTPRLHGPKPLHAPTGLAATTGCDGFLSARTELSWTPAGRAKGGYEIWRREPGVPNYRLVARIADWRTTSFTDVGLAVDVTYRYVVRAVDGVRVSLPTGEVAAPTPLFCVV